MRQDLALSIILKVSQNLDLVESNEDRKRFLGLFQSYQTAFVTKKQDQDTFVECEFDVEQNQRYYEVYKSLLVIEKIFNLESIDDSFKFNQELNEIANEFSKFLSQIVDQGQHYYADIDPDFKVEEGYDQYVGNSMDQECVIQQYIENLKKISYNDDAVWGAKREHWVLFCEQLVNQLACVQGKKWRDPGIKQLIKTIFFNKDMIFNEVQKERLAISMEKVLKGETQNAVLMKKVEQRDGEILQNPLNSKNEVKDSRTWAVSLDGLDKWGMKQMGL